MINAFKPVDKEFYFIVEKLEELGFIVNSSNENGTVILQREGLQIDLTDLVTFNKK